MKHKYIIVVILLLPLFLQPEDFKDVNRGLSVLEINTSPISSTYDGGYGTIFSFVSSLNDNPAILSNIENLGMKFNHYEVGFDMRMDDIIISKNMAKNFGLMLGISYFDGGEIELRGEIPEDQPIATANFSDFIISLSGGYKIYKELQVGVTAKIISQYAYIYSGITSSFSGGVLFYPYILKGVIISFELDNFGPTMNFGESDKISQPSRIKFAIGRRFDIKRFRSNIGVSIGGYSKYYISTDSDSLSFMESFKNTFIDIPKKVNCKIAVDYLYDGILNLRSSYVLGGENTIASFGAGLIVKKIRFDYSYTLEKNTRGSNRFSIGIVY
ncbi:PorV/PorQ family protein [candidate division WOR-3 bacterium]|jgi:hypothetical protein|nr:PorV/PorQ family protein [candidate division WOR-3 bacterium]